MEDDGFADWKAKLFIEILHIFILTIIVGQIQLITKWRIIPNEIPKIWIIPILLIIVNFTDKFFSFEKWKNYEEEFRSYSRQKNRLINFIVFCIIFGTLLLLIFTFYLYSKVDWTKYK
jgi:hypothetical protein